MRDSAQPLKYGDDKAVSNQEANSRGGVLVDPSIDDVTTPLQARFECISLVFIIRVFKQTIVNHPLWGSDLNAHCQVLSLPGRSTLTGMDLISCSQ